MQSAFFNEGFLIQISVDAFLLKIMYPWFKSVDLQIHISGGLSFDKSTLDFNKYKGQIMKHEWKKNEKQFYLPKNKPESISIPKFKFFVIDGKGNPNDDFFAEYIGVLYSLSYGVKMSPKKGMEPKGYFDYTVYPLEGVWDLNEEAKKSYNGTINKNDLVFKLMIRQPDFVDSDFALQILEQTKKNKPHELLEQVRFEEIVEGESIQMLHLGSYDNEPESFKIMESFAEQANYKRKTMTHREIYLSDARKVSPDKLNTVLRFSIEKK